MDDKGLKPIDCYLASDPTVHKVYLLGYDIRYKFEVNRPFLQIKAFCGSRCVGNLSVEINKASGQIHADNILVMQPEHRRKGLASAMMVCAEKLTGLVMVPATNQIADGRALWDRPNRPWGNGSASRVSRVAGTITPE